MPSAEAQLLQQVGVRALGRQQRPTLEGKRIAARLDHGQGPTGDSRVPIENRRPGLSWSAHAVCARLPHKVQHDLLLEAERRGWTTEELRAKSREAMEAADG